MSLANPIYRVNYGFFDSTGVMRGAEQYADVQAADTKESTLVGILNSNGKTRPGLTTKILSFRNVAHDAANVLS